MKEIEGPILPKICDWMLNKNYESRFPSFSFISSKMAGQQTRWGEQTKKRQNIIQTKRRNKKEREGCEEREREREGGGMQG